jgi:hypothetical protein
MLTASRTNTSATINSLASESRSLRGRTTCVRDSPALSFRISTKWWILTNLASLGLLLPHNLVGSHSHFANPCFVPTKQTWNNHASRCFLLFLVLYSRHANVPLCHLLRWLRLGWSGNCSLCFWILWRSAQNERQSGSWPARHAGVPHAVILCMLQPLDSYTLTNHFVALFYRRTRHWYALLLVG